MLYCVAIDNSGGDGDKEGRVMGGGGGDIMCNRGKKHLVGGDVNTRRDITLITDTTLSLGRSASVNSIGYTTAVQYYSMINYSMMNYNILHRMVNNSMNF